MNIIDCLELDAIEIYIDNSISYEDATEDYFYNYLSCFNGEVKNIRLPRLSIDKIDINVVCDIFSSILYSERCLIIRAPISTECIPCFKGGSGYKFFDPHVIFPYNIYENLTGRPEYLNARLLSCSKNDNVFLDSLSSLVKLTNLFCDSIPSNSVVYFFTKFNEFKFNELDLIEKLECGICNNYASRTLFVELYLFYYLYYKVNLLDVFSIGGVARDKVLNIVTLLKNDDLYYDMTTSWYKDLDVSIFGVNIGECLDYFVMEDLVRVKK